MSIKDLTGSTLADLLRGNEGRRANVLRGGARNDLLYGGGGADTLYGEADESDALEGSAGADTLDGGEGERDVPAYGGGHAGEH